MTAVMCIRENDNKNYVMIQFYHDIIKSRLRALELCVCEGVRLHMYSIRYECARKPESHNHRTFFFITALQ